jgi:hypothetical protein
MAKTGRSLTSDTNNDPDDSESLVLEPRPPRQGTQARTGQPPQIRTILTDSDVESDNEDFSEVLEDVNPDAESQESVDTTVLAEMGTGSQRFFSHSDSCLVRLGQKVTVAIFYAAIRYLTVPGLAISSCEPRTTDADKKVFTTLRLTQATRFLTRSKTL